MKYLQINAFSYGSTGPLMMLRHRELMAAGVDSYVCWGRGRDPIEENEIRIGANSDVYLHAVYARVTGKVGFASKCATRHFVQQLDRIRPDVVHLHVLHGYYLNLPILFEWLQASDCQVIWTQHDCWAFTGHCAHFIRANCDQWKDGCDARYRCPQLREYPKTFSRSCCAWNYEHKRKLFTSLSPDRMSITVPSHWLEKYVKASFLSKYAISVEPNKVNETIFYHRESDWRRIHGLEGRFIVLGVASPWTEQKGFSDFLRLARDLDESCAVVMVGLRKKELSKLPGNVVGICRTSSQDELAEIYSAADIFINPSIEETFSMTVAEAQACGTHVLVRRGTACEEIASPERMTSVDWTYPALLQAVNEYRASCTAIA